jgi:hypothetical protein
MQYRLDQKARSIREYRSSEMSLCFLCVSDIFEGASSLDSDLEICVIVTKSLDSILNVLCDPQSPFWRTL